MKNESNTQRTWALGHRVQNYDFGIMIDDYSVLTIGKKLKLKLLTWQQTTLKTMTIPKVGEQVIFTN